MKAINYVLYFVLLTLVLIGPGCISIMSECTPLSGPETGYALITFVFRHYDPGSFPFHDRITIWQDDRCVGVDYYNAYQQLPVKEGKAVFYGHGINWTIMETDLKAGREYYVYVRIVPGYPSSMVYFAPVKEKSGEKVAELKEILNQARAVSVERMKSLDTLQQLQYQAFRQARYTYKSGNARVEFVGPDDNIELARDPADIPKKDL